MNQILTCVLCGRRGTHEFVMTTANPEVLEQGHRARCGNRKACQRRIAQAHDTTQPQQSAKDDSGSVTLASVAGLAREVEALRRVVAPLLGLAGQVEDLARVVGELAEKVTALSARPRKVIAPSWLDLPADLDTTQEVLAELGGWLHEVFLRYPDAAKALPECWLWHPEVIEELLWLRHAWHAAYQAPGATVGLAGDWHDRYRPGVVKRINTTAGTCSLDNHHPRNGEHLPAGPVVPLAEAMAPLAAWWATGRHDTPPEPTQSQLQHSATHRPRSGARR